MSDEKAEKQWAIMHVDPSMTPTIGKLAEALAKAQLAMGNAAKDSVNPHFKSKYADLASVREAVIPHLAANGIAVVQRIESKSKDGVAVSTMLIHSSGEWIQDECWLPVTRPDAQGFGSAITYARRYSLAAVAGIAADEDDDGNAAVGKPSGDIAQSSKNRPQAANTDKPKTGPKDDGTLELRAKLHNLQESFDAKEWDAAKKTAQALKAKGVEFDQDFKELYSAVRVLADKKAA